MGKITLSMLALAAGVFAQGIAPTSANAMPLAKSGIAASHEGVTQVRRDGNSMGGGNFSRRSFSGNRFIGSNHIGRRSFSGNRFIGSNHIGQRRFSGNRFHRRHHFGSRIYFYNTYGYYNNCSWLKRKALYTGSRYWWNRYWECRNGY